MCRYITILVTLALAACTSNAPADKPAVHPRAHERLAYSDGHVLMDTVSTEAQQQAQTYPGRLRRVPSMPSEPRLNNVSVRGSEPLLQQARAATDQIVKMTACPIASDQPQSSCHALEGASK